MNIFSVEANRLQDPQSLRQDLVADSIARHGDYGMFRHQ
jgi:hypothetical protein